MKKAFRLIISTLFLASVVWLTGMVKVSAAPLNMPDGTVFDPVFYAETYKDLKTYYGYNAGALWKHYNECGKNEGRIPTASYNTVGWVAVMEDGGFFNPTFYAENNPDVVAACGSTDKALYKHYVNFGKAEHRQGYPGETFLTPGIINKNVPYPYYIRINRAACTVTVFGADEKGEYTVPYKAFVCSPGTDTPLGVFRSAQNARWLAFDGNQYGQYTKRIVNRIWFHSVMYNGKNPANLDWRAYNRLGTVCSHGCIRLEAGNAKWIYENCPVGTVVEIYDDAANPGPLGKPAAMKINGGDPRRGWDPTDPDPANPWLQ